MDATRVTLGDRFPKGSLLTTHDHALLTKNFCALAPEYKGTLSHLEERAQRAHYRTCYAWHARTCADRRARRVFFSFANETFSLTEWEIHEISLILTKKS